MTAPEKMWSLMMAGSEELADELGLEAPPEVFQPDRATRAIDLWLAEREPLDEEEAAQLGFFLARVLVETHGGGLALIREPGHALDGEWAVTGFERGLGHDYHVPFLVSAARIGVDRSLTAAEWYAQLKREGAAA
jgi:hypothetical protein